MAEYFKILGYPNVYINPVLGKVNLSKPFTDAQALAWYKEKSFPYITPIEGAERFLAKEKVGVILDLIDRAKTPEEVAILKAAKPESKKVQDK